MPRAGAASVGRGDLLLVLLLLPLVLLLLLLCSCWVYRWCCCSCWCWGYRWCWCRCRGLDFAPSCGGVGGDALPLRLGESRLLPSPGRRRSCFCLSHRPPGPLSAKAAPRAPSSSSPQAGADTPLWPSLRSPVPRLAASGKGSGGERGRRRQEL